MKPAPINFVNSDTPRIQIEQSKPPGTIPMRKNVRVTNRAEKGSLKGQPILLGFAGKIYPEEADVDDTTTWLQPGESVVLDKDIIIANFGNICFHKEKNAFDKASRDSVANRFGGYLHEPVPSAGLNTRQASMRIIGPPVNLPDVVLEQLDSRGKAISEPVAVFDIITSGVVYQKLK